jgi:hypothetical protein
MTRIVAGLLVILGVSATLAVANVGCGHDATLGTYVNTSYFLTLDGQYPVVSRVFLESGGKWRMLTPTTNANGTTTPFWLHGTYTVKGSKVTLVMDGEPFLSGILKGNKLTVFVNGLVFVKK